MAGESGKLNAQNIYTEIEKVYPEIINSVGAAIFIFCEDKNVFANKTSEEITGYTREEIITMDFWEFIHPDFRDLVRERGNKRQQGESVPQSYELKIVTKAGEIKWINFSGRLLQIAGQNCVLGIAQDITTRKAVEFALKRMENKNSAILKAIPDLMFVISREGTLLDYHANDRENLYLKSDEIIGANINDKMPAQVANLFMINIVQCLDKGSLRIFDYTLPKKAGLRTMEARLIRKDNHEVLAIVQDITDKKEYQQRIEDLAFTDSLTNLPNRRTILEKFSEIDWRRFDRAALLYIDIDRFKTINEALGHKSGDLLLSQVADRFRSVIPPEALLGRHGGDEFLVVLPGADRDAAVSLAENIQHLMLAPFRVEERNIYITVSVGIALHPHHGNDAEALLMNADTAMYEIKKLGGQGTGVYDTGLQARSLLKLETDAELRKALAEDRFFLEFQARFSIPDRKVTGAEALVRWKKGDNVVYPGSFIPLAEETGMIIPLGREILRKAMESSLPWLKLFPDFRLAVNLSPRQFQDRNLYSCILDTLLQTGFPPRNLEVEITEESLILDKQNAGDTLENLRNAGISIALDDFGRGYSSLSQLADLPIHILKIDQSFIRNLGQQKDSGIVRAILALGEELGLRVIAEGVENETQFQLLQEFGCPEMQGYLLGKPTPEQKFTAMLLRSAD